MNWTRTSFAFLMRTSIFGYFPIYLCMYNVSKITWSWRIEKLPKYVLICFFTYKLVYVANLYRKAFRNSNISLYYLSTCKAASRSSFNLLVAEAQHRQFYSHDDVMCQALYIRLGFTIKFYFFCINVENLFLHIQRNIKNKLKLRFVQCWALLIFEVIIYNSNANCNIKVLRNCKMESCEWNISSSI